MTEQPKDYYIPKYKYEPGAIKDARLTPKKKTLWQRIIIQMCPISLSLSAMG